MRYLSSKERTPWGLLAHQPPQLADEKWPKWGDDTFVQLFTLSRTRVTCPQPPGVKVEQGAVHYGTMCLKTKFLNGKRVDCIWFTTFPSYTSTSVTVSRTWVWQIFSLYRLYLTLQPLLDLPILNHDSCIWIEWLKIIFVFEGGRKIGHNFLQILIFIYVVYESRFLFCILNAISEWIAQVTMYACRFLGQARWVEKVFLTLSKYSTPPPPGGEVFKEGHDCLCKRKGWKCWEFVFWAVHFHFLHLIFFLKDNNIVMFFGH